MEKNLNSKNIDQLMVEADELIKQINSDAIRHLKEEHRLQLEMHAQNLTKLRSEVQDRMGNSGSSEIGSGAEGIHEAIDDIVTAMKTLMGDLI